MDFSVMAVNQAMDRARRALALRRRSNACRFDPSAAEWFLALLHRIRWPSMLLGLAWWSAFLPAWAQATAGSVATGAAPIVEAIKQQAVPTVSAVGTKIASPVVAETGQRLMNSYELCKIGRMGQHELSFLTVFILIGCFIFFLQIDRRLIRHGWEIRKALSESNEISFLPEGNKSSPLLNRRGDAVAVRVLEPSVSRLIALCGLIMLILFYFGFGLISLYHFGRTCEMPGDIQGVTTFLYAGLTFFAPYLVSKFSAIFASPGRRLPPPAVNPDSSSEAQEATAQATQVSMASSPSVRAAASNGSTPSGDSLMAAAAMPPASVAGPAAAAPVQQSPAGIPAALRHHEGVELIKEFEGFRDKAYPDPASGGDPWTIGYGFTRINNKAVVPGQTITKTAADQLLAEMLDGMAGRFSSKIPFWNDMHDKQQSCLLSFAWNLGEGFYGNESDFHTITQCLRNKDWSKVANALLLYSMPGTSVHEGLLRRRKAEADLWERGMAAAGPSAASTTSGLVTGSPPRPIAAGSTTNGNQPSFSQAQPAIKPLATATAVAHPNPLPVEYYDQMLMDDGQGWRDCFSASCGMLARYWGKINDQNKYNHLRQKYGDSTDNNAQLKALQSLGLKASFRTDGKADTLKAEIDAGRPVAVGWLHHGSVSAPSGGGHWTVVIGYDESGFWMNDPYGSCDLLNGGYPGGGNPNDQLGKREHYSYKNWLPRWLPAGSPGWYLICSP